MKRWLFLALMFLSKQVLALGPTLGIATDVVVANAGVDDDRSSVVCKEFKLSVAQAKAFLDRAAIVTQREVHDYYDLAPCYVRGTVNFHGYPASWEIRAGGTGSITLMGGEYLPIVDIRERNVMRRAR